MSLDSMRDLLVMELRDVYSAETQLVKALPKLVDAAVAPTLKNALQNHLAETEEQVLRLERAFTDLDLPIKGKRCKGMEGLIDEATDMVDDEAAGPIRDAGIVGAAQRVEHYEIAAYGTIITYAQLLGLDHIASDLRMSLEEEKTANDTLTDLAESEINELAFAVGFVEKEET
jgi:ferritin-like metal-binding protein YciE